MTEKYLTVTQTINWLKEHAQIGNADLEIDRKFLKSLNDSARLMPDKTSLFGKRYALTHLMTYASDVKPR